MGLSPVRAENKPLSLKLSTVKRAYVLGEVVQLRQRIENRTSGQIAFGSDVGAMAFIQIAYAGGPFETYREPPPAFSVDGVIIDFSIDPHKSIVLERDVLWKYLPNLGSHGVFNQPVSMPSNLAFPVVGRYSVRIFAQVKMNGNWVEQTSKPVAIEIVEPVGKDVSVWKMIEARNDIAYFMQFRQFPRELASVAGEADRFRLMIDGLLASNPDTTYSARLRSALECNKPVGRLRDPLASLHWRPQPCN